MTGSSLYVAAGAFYAIAFLIVGYRWPRVALMLVIAGAPLQSDLSGSNTYQAASGKFSIAELNLALTTIIFLIKWFTRERQLVFGSVVVAALLYIGICVISALGNWEGMTSIVTIVQMVLYLVIAVIVFASLPVNAADGRWAWYGYMATCSVLALVATIAARSYVLGLHKNGLGDSLGAAVLIGCELWLTTVNRTHRKWIVVALALCGGGLIVTLSRGAWIGAMVGLLVLCLVRRQFAVVFKAAIVILPIAVICWHILPEKDVETATDFSSNRFNIKARYMSIDIARDYFEKAPILGAGVSIRKHYDATNIFWFTLAETGILGLVAFAGVHLAVGNMVWSAARRTDPKSPGYSFLVLAASLVTLKLVHGLVDHYWTRGSIMCAWGAVGLATRVATLRHTPQPVALPTPEGATSLPAAPKRRRVFIQAQDGADDGPSSLDISW